jgi:hypothetical protein
VEEDEGISTQPTGWHDDDRLYCSDSQGSVEGIAAFLQDLDTHTRSQGRIRTNHSAATIDQTPRQAMHCHNASTFVSRD